MTLDNKVSLNPDEAVVRRIREGLKLSLIHI